MKLGWALEDCRRETVVANGPQETEDRSLTRWKDTNNWSQLDQGRVEQEPMERIDVSLLPAMDRCR